MAQFSTAAGGRRRLALLVLAAAVLAGAAGAQPHAPPPAPPPGVPPPPPSVVAPAPPTQEPSILSPLPPDEPEALTLTWDDCVALAARRNPTLVAADYAEKASRYSYYGSYDGVLPSLTLTNSYARNNTVNGVAIGSQGLYTAAATANWSLFNMGQVASIRTAKAGYNQALANQRLASASLRFNLRAAFASVYFARESLEMTRRIEKIQKQNAEEVSLRYQSGNEYKGNMMNSNAQYLVARINTIQAVRSLRAAVKTLDQYLGLDEFSNVVVTGTLVAQTPPNFPGRMSDFLETRPDVAVQEAVVQSARASLASSESPLYPNFSVNYSRLREGGTEFPSHEYIWTAGATLSYPIFAGGPASTYFNVRSSQQSLADQESLLRATREAALANLENAWASYANAVDQAVGEQAVLESYRQRNDEGAVRYAAGLVTFDNWQVIVTQWVGAEQTSITNWQQAVTAQAAWEQALGKALGEE
jgi:outer membrane protein TolC